MFEIRRYSADRADEWNQFVAQSKNGTFLFDRGYMDYHADRFDDHSLMCYLDSSLYTILPANHREKTLFSHQGLTYGGLVMTDEATTAKICTLFDEINDFLRAEGIERVVYKPVPRVFHKLPSDEDLFAIFLRCRAKLVGRKVSSAVVPQRPVKWKRYRRYAANKGRNDGVEVRQTDDFKAFWTILTDNLAQKHDAKPVHTFEEIALLHRRFPKNIQLWAAFAPTGEMLGATVMYVGEHFAHTQYMSASDEGKRLRAMDVLIDHLLHEVFPKVDFFDFGTSNLPDGNELHESLIYQKEGFGGRAVCYDTYEWDV